MMENLQREELWKKTTRGLYRAVLIFTLSGVAMFVVACVMGVVMGMSSRSGNMMAASGVWIGLVCLTLIGVLIGYVLYIKGLFELKRQVAPADKPMVSLLGILAVLVVVLPSLSFTPKLKIIFSIAVLILSAVQMVCYWRLMKSPTFPALARRGIARVFWSTVIGLGGVLLGFTAILSAMKLCPAMFWGPAGMGVAVLLITLTVVMFMTLSGWRCVADSEAPVLPE